MININFTKLKNIFFKKQVSNPLEYLHENIINKNYKIENNLEEDFYKNSNTKHQIPKESQVHSSHFIRDFKLILDNCSPTSSPYFIGHMTSSLPNFLLELAKLITEKNQNLVKVETSKSFTKMELDCLYMLHNLIYQNHDYFYSEVNLNSQFSLGSFCSGGTIANITALWAARNNLLCPSKDFQGVQSEGVVAALRYYGYKNLAVIVSERAHYSIKKSVDILGLGINIIHTIPTDKDHKIRTDLLEQKMNELESQQIKVLTVVGIAGSTETGHVDDLLTMSIIAKKYQCHFHVDAAWGGATMTSARYKHILRGIEQADSVTVDAHKQFYIPMGLGMVLFKKPQLSKNITHHANYILRKDSNDLGRFSIEGSRSGMSLMLYVSFKVFGLNGYEILINESIEKAQYFSRLIKESENFQLITHPELCILTYRYLPSKIQKLIHKDSNDYIHAKINDLNVKIQEKQKQNGNSFVSRTKLLNYQYGYTMDVFRVVLANPLTQEKHLKKILHEQEEIGQNLLDTLVRFTEKECEYN